MENETEVEDKPVDNEEVFELSNFTDGFNGEDSSSSGETEQPTDVEVNKQVETKEEEKEVDYTPLLNTLSTKIKYKDEEIKIENIDDVVTNYQKGKNYDTLQDKLNSLENSEEMQYLNQLAKENGMTRAEYIKTVKANQVQAQLQAEQNELNEMITNGVPEHIARKVIETNKIAKELKEEKLQIAEDKKQAEEKQKKDAENDDFLKAFPDVKVSEIPKEVFANAQKSNLKSAYTEYQLQETKKELEALKHEKQVKQKSPIKSVTLHGGIINEKEDPFMEGFNSED